MRSTIEHSANNFICRKIYSQYLIIFRLISISNKLNPVPNYFCKYETAEMYLKI